MSFIVLAIVLALSYRLPSPGEAWLRRMLDPLLDGLADKLDGGLRNDGWVAIALAVGIVVVPLATVWFWLRARLAFATYLLDIALLYGLVGFWRVSHELQDATLAAARRPGEVRDEHALAARAGVMAVHRSTFAVLFWYVILPGPVGVLVQLVVRRAASRWQAHAMAPFAAAATQLEALMEWPAERATALTFAVVGNFEDALYAWRTQARAAAGLPAAVALAAAAGALSLRFAPLAGDPPNLDLGSGEGVDAGGLESVEALIWRSLGLWLGLLLLLALARAF